jgi:branched-chain amino acid transport system permease protein
MTIFRLSGLSPRQSKATRSHSAARLHSLHTAARSNACTVVIGLLSPATWLDFFSSLAGLPRFVRGFFSPKFRETSGFARKEHKNSLYVTRIMCSKAGKGMRFPGISVNPQVKARISCRRLHFVYQNIKQGSSEPGGCMDFNFDILLQQIFNGLVLGSVYALVALGYTMVYGILQLINFAHGDVLMVGAMVAVTVVGMLIKSGLPLPIVLIVAILVAIPVCILLSLFIERVAYRPLRNAPRLAPLITAIGVSIVIQTLAMMIWKPNPIVFPDLLPTTPIMLGEVVMAPKQLLILFVSAVMMVGLIVLVNKTRLGRAMRATAENPRIAGLMGVNANQVIAATFAIGAALAAIAGVLVAMNYNIVQFTMGFMPGLKAFTAAVLGGIGNLAGAMVGGLLLGVIESLAAGYIGDITGGFLGSNYQDIFAFVVLIIVLVFKPSGIMGERVADRA